MDKLSLNLRKCVLLVFISSFPITACASFPVQEDTQEPITATTTMKHATATAKAFGDPFENADLAIIGMDGNILLADIDSEKIIPLTDDALTDPLSDETFIAYGEPTWSPTDNRLAFIRTVRTGSGMTNVEIVVAGLGFDPVEIAAEDERPFYIYWSPNGDELGFLASQPGDTISFWVKDLQNQGSRLDRGQPYYWDWAPDGSQLISHVGGSVAFNPDGAYLSFFNPERKDIDLAPLSFQAPAYSPDGERILVVSRPRPESDSLLMLNAEGEIFQEVDQVEGRTSFAWSPDGSHFAVVEGPDLGSVQIGRLSLFQLGDDGVAELTKNIAEAIIAFWWSPDGRQIAYFVPVLSPPDLTQPVVMNRQDDNELFLQLFVYDLERDTSRRLSSFRPSAELLRIMSYFDQYQRSSTIWSTDSQMITFASLGQDGAEMIFVVSASGDEVPQRVTQGQIAYWMRR
jgi:Tol biopolymer transport system component